MLTWIKGWFANRDADAEVVPMSRQGETFIEKRISAATVNAPEQPEVISLRLTITQPPQAVQAVQAVQVPANLLVRKPSQTPIRSRRLATGLNEFRFATSSRIAQLRYVGIGDAGQLRAANADRLISDGFFPVAVRGWLKRRQRIVKLFLQVRSLRPIDATILFAIHRRTVQSIAAENPVRLWRDTQRYLLSSSGQKLLNRCPAPTAQAVESWVEDARRRLERTRAESPHNTTES